jgi:hypothetical protein
MNQLFSFQNEPYIFMPIGINPDFDMSCFYMVSILQETGLAFEQLFLECEKMCDNNNYTRDNFIRIYCLAETIINNYSKMIKCLKPDEKLQKRLNQLFINPDYGVLDDTDLAIIGLRNTTQHFEERIQELNRSTHLANFYISVTYENNNSDNWCISFGNSGFRLGGTRVDITAFDISKLFFSSYIKPKINEDSSIKVFKVSFSDIMNRIDRIKSVFEENIFNNTPESVKNCPTPHIIALTQS